MTFYPIKFNPILKERIWGGNKLVSKFKKQSNKPNIGESWEISAVKDDVSIIANGPLKGQSLKELISKHKGSFVGEGVYSKFGDEFPLLIKFIDANKDLSIQVHPNDQQSNGHGKTEMWYVLHADPNAYLLSGFNQEVNKEQLKSAIVKGNFEDYMNKISVKSGDTFFIKANHVHSIGAGVMIAEIQQTSDITYRIYDFNRKDEKGHLRDLHINDAFGVMQLGKDTGRVNCKNQEYSQLVHVPEFSTYKHQISNSIKIKAPNSHFKIIIGVKGSGSYFFNGKEEIFSAGETLFIPANLEIMMSSTKGLEVLETYIDCDLL